MRIACWIPKATNILSEYVIIFAIPLQLWLHERAPVLRYTYIALFYYNIYCYAYGLFTDGSRTA